MKISVLPTECDCDKCSRMCTAPCCGTIEDMQNLIDAGYGNRLMLDDWPDDNDIIKPAMKGHEGGKAPWDVRTEEGCTFWKDGKCELHQSGLKPTQGKLAHHDNDYFQLKEIENFISDSWGKDEAKEFIEKWKIDFLKYQKKEAKDVLNEFFNYFAF